MSNFGLVVAWLVVAAIGLLAVYMAWQALKHNDKEDR